MILKALYNTINFAENPLKKAILCKLSVRNRSYFFSSGKIESYFF